jgi:hypothetical protein
MVNDNMRRKQLWFISWYLFGGAEGALSGYSVWDFADAS